MSRYLSYDNFCCAHFPNKIFDIGITERAFSRIALPRICQTSVMECAIRYKYPFCNLDIHFPCVARIASGAFRYFTRYL